MIDPSKMVETLNELLSNGSLIEIKKCIEAVKEKLDYLGADQLEILNVDANGQTLQVKKQYLNSELEQILETRSIERTKYYIQRLIKGLSEIKTSKINDINLNRWKEYEDIFTDSLWILKKRDHFGAHSAGYWGNFIPQIPNQLLRRYTKKGEWVLDPFLGSGTTLIECNRLGRNGIGIELQEDVAALARNNLEKDKKSLPKPVRTEVITGDSTTFSFAEALQKVGVNTVQFLMMHPPYWDIIEFSDDKRDLSNAETIDQFLAAFGRVVDNTFPVLDKGRYLAVVIGDKYAQGEWIPLGFSVMQEILKRGYSLKSIIVKNVEETKGKMNQKELWRYRALVGGFYIFKHEYIFLFKKK